MLASLFGAVPSTMVNYSTFQSQKIIIKYFVEHNNLANKMSGLRKSVCAKNSFMSTAYHNHPSEIIMSRRKWWRPDCAVCHHVEWMETRKNGSKLSSFRFMSPSKREITSCTYYAAGLLCGYVCVVRPVNGNPGSSKYMKICRFLLSPKCIRVEFCAQIPELCAYVHSKML